jgi:thiol-disulfide isomerase/thioredoxin
MFYENFSATVQSSFSGKMVKEQIIKKYGVAVGSPAFNFQAKDISGAVVDLSSFKGKKYVLLDFWASWCIPCRSGNPRLIELYKKYHDKGLEIISISTDIDQANWKKAILHDHTDIWYHVLSDPEKKNNAVAGRINEVDIGYKYVVALLPTKILLNKSGVIICRSESDDDNLLSEKLKEVFGF